jgi:hypothetical protein
MARLKPGVTLQQANANMDSVTRHIAEAYPVSNKNWGASVEYLQNDFVERDIIRNLWLMMGAVGFVLLIACVNVANLLLARGTARQKEIGVCTSLGATSGQLFLQFLIESLALASTGGALGVALAWIPVKAIVLLLPPYALPSEAVYGLNLQILLFTLVTSPCEGKKRCARFDLRADRGCSQGPRTGATSQASISVELMTNVDSRNTFTDIQPIAQFRGACKWLKDRKIWRARGDSNSRPSGS